MTARVGTKSVDGTPISRADLARIEAEEQLHAHERLRAVRVVAAGALGADDCRTLLSILGLDAKVAARPAAEAAVQPARVKRSHKPHAA